MIKKTFLSASANLCSTHVPSSPCSLGAPISRALLSSRSGAEEKGGSNRGHEMAFAGKKLSIGGLSKSEVEDDLGIGFTC